MTRDVFIRLLNNQKSQNNMPFTKINIHIALRGKIVEYCLSLNKEIQVITNSYVDFSPASFQIPHLTIEMGYIKNKTTFKNLMNELHDFAKELTSFEVIPKKAYIQEPERNYIFIDTDKNELILEIKRKAKERFKNWIVPLDWDVSAGIPHITVGFITDNYFEIDKLIEKYPIGPIGIADNLEISYTGSKGTCIGTIRSFEFGN